MTAIVDFREEFEFLSNFSHSPLLWEGIKYETVEAAYQASKTTDLLQRHKIAAADSPATAKKLGRGVVLRSDWETKKFEVMESLLRIKFSNPDLEKQLLNTGNRVLIEGNSWGDTIWGESPLGVGQNHLGKLLMKIRAEKQKEQDDSTSNTDR